MTKSDPKIGAVEFNQEVKHGTNEKVHRFFPGQVVGFEDHDAVAYFTKLGWADASTKKPVMTLSIDELDIDPDTVQNRTGLKVADITTTSEG